MAKLIYLTTIIFLFFTNQVFAQSKDALRKKIEQIVASKKAVVGVSIFDGKGKNETAINGEKHFPMQSVFKFHIGLAMLSEIDKGKFSLDQKVEIGKKDLLLNLYSPIRDKFPNGTTLTIVEILEYTISQSDNVGCDVLLRLLGGPSAVENYFVKNKFKDVSIKYSEEQQHANQNLQFENWTTPKSANIVLKAFYDNKKKMLSQNSYDFLLKAMRETNRGQNRIEGQLPENIVVAHRPGTSSAAVNDIGIVFLPDGRHFFISVFVTDSKEDTAANEKIIADIAKASWDYFIAKSN